jgi:Ca2+:H+ antiporter
MTTRPKPRRGSRQSTSPYTHEPKPQQEREDGNLPQYNSNGHAVTRGIQPNGESGRRGFHPVHFLRVCWASSCTASKYVNVLWPFVPAAIALVCAPFPLSCWFKLIDTIVAALRQT